MGSDKNFNHTRNLGQNIHQVIWTLFPTQPIRNISPNAKLQYINIKNILFLSIITHRDETAVATVRLTMAAILKSFIFYCYYYYFTLDKKISNDCFQFDYIALLDGGKYSKQLQAEDLFGSLIAAPATVEHYWAKYDLTTKVPNWEKAMLPVRNNSGNLAFQIGTEFSTWYNTEHKITVTPRDSR